MAGKLAHDLRDQFGPVRDQGERPTCLSFAASALHEAARKHNALSVEDLHYHAHDALNDLPLPNRGVTYDAVKRALAAKGQTDEEVWPYRSAVDRSHYQPPSACTRQRCALVALVGGFAEIRAQIEAGIPLVLVLAICPEFHRAPNAVVADHASFAPRALHAVVAVGASDHPDGLLVRNSWGADWGAQGHAIVAKDYITARLRHAGVADIRSCS